MASNFKISLGQNKGRIHLALRGDFDGSAACQLIHTLKSHYGKGVKFHIDTSTLSAVHPFGLKRFQRDCMIYNLTDGLTFAGKHGAALAPARGA